MMNEELIAALSERKLQAEEVGPTLNIRKGTGPLSRAVNVDFEAVQSWLEARDARTRRRDVAGWATGVETTLLEPRHSDARRWSYVEAAGSIFPTIEGAGFARGVQDATGGDAAWTLPFGDADDLVIAWVLRLNRGLRPLTEAQVQDWSVTQDRIVSAGRSLLFHATRQHSWKPTQTEDVLALSVGDGHDAARILVAADVFFTEIDADWRFAIPHPDMLLAVRTPDHIGQLIAEAQRVEADAEYPLDTRAWRIGGRGPELAEG